MSPTRQVTDIVHSLGLFLLIETCYGFSLDYSLTVFLLRVGVVCVLPFTPRDKKKVLLTYPKMARALKLVLLSLPVVYFHWGYYFSYQHDGVGKGSVDARHVQMWQRKLKGSYVFLFFASPEQCCSWYFMLLFDCFIYVVQYAVATMAAGRDGGDGGDFHLLSKNADKQRIFS